MSSPSLRHNGLFVFAEETASLYNSLLIRFKFGEFWILIGTFACALKFHLSPRQTCGFWLFVPVIHTIRMSFISWDLCVISQVMQLATRFSDYFTRQHTKIAINVFHCGLCVIYLSNYSTSSLKTCLFPFLFIHLA